MQFIYFHLMPWPHLDESFESERSAWVTYSNANYDPQRGAELYEQYLDQLVYAEELGFDAIAVNEHHQTAYGLMPSPDVIASYLVARTRKAKIAILGKRHSPARPPAPGGGGGRDDERHQRRADYLRVRPGHWP